MLKGVSSVFTVGDCARRIVQSTRKQGVLSKFYKSAILVKSLHAVKMIAIIVNLAGSLYTEMLSSLMYSWTTLTIQVAQSSTVAVQKDAATKE